LWRNDEYVFHEFYEVSKVSETGRELVWHAATARSCVNLEAHCRKDLLMTTLVGLARSLSWRRLCIGQSRMFHQETITRTASCASIVYMADEFATMTVCNVMLMMLRLPVRICRAAAFGLMDHNLCGFVSTNGLLFDKHLPCRWSSCISYTSLSNSASILLSSDILLNISIMGQSLFTAVLTRLVTVLLDPYFHPHYFGRAESSHSLPCGVFW
jgi:hypothetical protein